MPKHFCYYCFQTLRPDQEESVRCTSCGRSYHEQHWDGKCINCTGTVSKPYRPPSSPRLRSTTRRPVRLVRRSIQTDQGDNDFSCSVAELLKQFGRALQQLFSALVGIGVATLFGAYTYRIIRYEEFNDLSAYVDSIIRGDIPADELFFAALIAASMGAFVFFPVQLQNAEGADSFPRRLTRLIAVLILLIYLSMLVRGFDVNSLERLFNYYQSGMTVTAFVSTTLIAQIGALSVTWLIGFVIRRINSPVSQSKLPKWIQHSFRVIRVGWHLLATTLVVLLATAISIELSSPYTQNTILLEFGRRAISADAVRLTSLIVTVFIALLLYHPPKHSGMRKKWWFLRAIGYIACFIGFIVVFRSTSVGSTQFILRTISLSTVVAISSVPVYRAIS